MSTSIRFALLFPVFAVATVHSHRLLDTSAESTGRSLESRLPSPYATRLLSLGHYALAADYYWLRALGHFGDRRRHQDLYPELEALLTRANTLDPYYISVYRLAGTALTLRGMDISHSNRLLQRGLKHRPDVWEIPFYLGFNNYYFERDFDKAAQNLARAARLPGAPHYTGQLATRLAAQAGEPEIGLRFVDQILAELPQDRKELRSAYEERRKLLQLEVELKWLNEAARRFREARRYSAPDLQTLLSAGLLTAIPEEPLGGRYFVGDGEVKTTNEELRLRLSERARPTIEGNEPEDQP